VPNNGNGQFYNATIGGGLLIQDITAGVTIEQLFMSGGTLRLDNPLTLNAGLQFSGGAIIGGSLFIAGTSDQSALMTVSNTTITNSGTYNISLDGSDVFSGSATFNNSGTLSKTTGTGTDNFNIALNNSGTVSAQNGTLRFTVGGTSASAFSASAGATVEFASNWTFTNGTHFSGAGTIQLDNNTFTTIAGTITNAGNISLNAGGNVADLILSGDVTLTGVGTITLEGFDRILGSGVLTNANNTIQGWSNTGYGLGVDQIGIINQASGLIDANVLNRALNVDPNAAAGGLVNQGLMQASNGGILLLNGNNGGSFTNTGGTIAALDGSEVQLVNNAAIIGGTLSTVGSGVIRNIGAASLTSLTIAGSFIGNDNTFTTIAGTITNTGNISLNAGGNVADLILSGDVTLTGVGTITLEGFDRILGSGVLTNVNNTIQGWSNTGYGLGFDQIGIINQASGLIDANVSGKALNVDPGPDNLVGGLINQGLMRASNGGILLLNGNNGGSFTNTGATITALDGSEVQLVNGASITGGTLSSSGTGVVRNLNTATLSSLTIAGSFIGNDNTFTTIAGTITNTGNISLNAGGNVADLILSGDVTLTGGGTITLEGFDRILGSGVLTNANNTIRGWSNTGYGLGFDQIGIINQASGLIDANVSGKALNVDPNNANGLTNNGLMRASNGGILLLNGNGGGGFNNNATITALDGSEVQLVNNAAIIGGTLSTVGSGVIRNIGAASLTSLTIAGSFIGNDNTFTTIAGTITNTGNISLNAGNNVADLILNGNVTLTGSGTITLEGFDRILGSGVLTNANNTIRGWSNTGYGLGFDQIGIINQASGLIDANVLNRALNVDPNAAAAGLINQGLMRASNGGILLLNGNNGGSFTNTGATITALDGSEVQLVNGASITGGTLSSSGTGVVRNLNTATLSSLTIAGSFIGNDNTFTTIAGTINNTGNISLNAGGNVADLILNGDVTLTGGGTITLEGFDRILGSGVLTNANNTIRGWSNTGYGLGFDQIGIINQASGLIDANVSGNTLNVDPNAANGLINQGLMQASNGGILLLNGAFGGSFTNSGTIKSVGGGVLQFNGTVTSSGVVDVGSGTLTATGNYTQTAGSFILAGGSVQSNNALEFQGGLVDARGTISAVINNSATLRPALGGSGLAVTGNVSLLAASNLSFQLGGITQGSQYGFMNVNGTVGLGGNLVVTFVNGFQNSVSSSNTFTVLSSTTTLSGAFANVASGARLETSDNSGNFLVTYSGSNIVLSDFMAGAFAMGSTFVVNTAGPITVNSDLESTPSGNAGTVELNSTADTVTVNSRIAVSSATPSSSIASARSSSAQGGNINIQSGKPTGVAINVSNGAQLLALLNAAAPGPGGIITIHATGVSSAVNIKGVVQADRGTVDVQHTGDSGEIYLGGTITDNLEMRGDIVKVGALGQNGTLTIGSGNISADTLLKLYAPGSNGSIDFVSNVTLSNQSSAVIIAANKVTIFNGVVVTIGGSTDPASVFTNIANYTGFGGNNSTTGTFAGNGATTQPLSGAPAFNDPLGSSASTGTAGANTNAQSVSGTNATSLGKVHVGTGGIGRGDLAATSGKTTGATINVSSSAQLLSLLDAAAPDAGGKITIPASKSSGSPGNSSRNNVGGRVKADRGAAHPRRMRDRRVINSTTGPFSGAPTDDPQPLASAPPFDQGKSPNRRIGSQ
jgi:hypothetical protein